MMSNGQMPSGGENDWRTHLHEVIFRADTRAGRYYDIALIITILLSVSVVMLDSVQSVRESHGSFLYAVEWFFTVLFTVDYVLRLACVPVRRRYATSFFGVVDLLGVLPTYLSIVLPGSHYLTVIRFFRVLRVFRVLNLSSYMQESQVLMQSLRASQRRITVFLLAVLSLVVVMGSLMYIIEGQKHGFTSIPQSIYWAIVTLTTVGYGDISPQTPFGQALAAVIMIMGYSIIVVPTGIVTMEMANASQSPSPSRACGGCGKLGHDPDAAFCKHCGGRL